MRESSKKLVEAGAVGLNFEDVTGDDESTLVPVALQMEKIRAIRGAYAFLSN